VRLERRHVPGPDGKRLDITIPKVPKGAKEGTKLRLRGKGVSRGKADGRGDQLVEIHIVPPEGADEALAQFMAEWEKTHSRTRAGRAQLDMIRESELIAQFAYLKRQVLLTWIEEGVIAPH
jgi:DnaJ-class molecular chaperone